MLAAYLSWTSSSSGVEQAFSQVDRTHLERGNGNNDCYRRAVVSLTDPNTAEAQDENLIQNARQLYSEGRSWTCERERQTRFDKGTKRNVSEKEGPGKQDTGTDGCTSEAQWHRMRKKSLQKAVATPCRKRGLDPETVEQDPSQIKASKRLKQVEEKKRIEAQCDGHLLENEQLNPRKVTQRPKKNVQG